MNVAREMSCSIESCYVPDCMWHICIDIRVADAPSHNLTATGFRGQHIHRSVEFTWLQPRTVTLEHCWATIGDNCGVDIDKESTMYCS